MAGVSSGLQILFATCGLDLSPGFSQPIVNCFIRACLCYRYLFSVGRYRAPVTAVGGMRYFEPGGVFLGAVGILRALSSS
jgi:hypothetical protein